MIPSPPPPLNHLLPQKGRPQSNSVSKEIKIVQVKSEHTDKDEDDMSTYSFSSYDGYFSSSSDSSKESDKETSKTPFKIKRKQDRINKKKQEDMELQRKNP